MLDANKLFSRIIYIVYHRIVTIGSMNIQQWTKIRHTTQYLHKNYGCINKKEKSTYLLWKTETIICGRRMFHPTIGKSCSYTFNTIATPEMGLWTIGKLLRLLPQPTISPNTATTIPITSPSFPSTNMVQGMCSPYLLNNA